jgi:hypothetical protein
VTGADAMNVRTIFAAHRFPDGKLLGRWNGRERFGSASVDRVLPGATTCTQVVVR